MTRQNPLTLVTPVMPEDHDALAAFLQKIKCDVQDHVPQQFEELKTIHYARWILLEPNDADGTPQPGIGPRLVFASDFDGDEDQHLTDLSTKSAEFMDSMYSHCTGYPAPSERNPASRKTYLSQWRVKSSAFFAGAPGRTLPQIKQENELRNDIWNFIKDSNWNNKSANEIHNAIKNHVIETKNFDWAKQPTVTPGIRWLGMALLGLILLILLPFIIIWVLIINFFLEPKDKPLGLTPSQVDEAHVKQLEAYEDFENQNQFTQVLVMKPGKIRLITLVGLMLFAKALIKNLFVNGKLMGIPTIHFARWVMVDDQKRMLFFSNFDGSWQQYLGDFIDKSGWGLTGIWSNTQKFPRTKFLFAAGAYDEEHFLAWSRYFQVPTNVWFCAYPNLSIKNIINNSCIRNELFRNLNEEKAQQFLNRF